METPVDWLDRPTSVPESRPPGQPPARFSSVWHLRHQPAGRPVPSRLETLATDRAVGYHSRATGPPLGCPAVGIRRRGRDRATIPNAGGPCVLKRVRYPDPQVTVGFRPVGRAGPRGPVSSAWERRSSPPAVPARPGPTPRSWTGSPRQDNRAHRPGRRSRRATSCSMRGASWPPTPSPPGPGAASTSSSRSPTTPRADQESSRSSSPVSHPNEPRRRWRRCARRSDRGRSARPGTSSCASIPWA
jgi:hypothetical protein